MVVCLLAIALVLWTLLLGNRSSLYQIAVAAITTWYVALFWIKYSDHPGDLMEADIVYLGVVGLYVVLPYFLAAFVPQFGDPDYLQSRSLLCVAAAMLGITAGLLAPAGKKLAGVLPRIDDEWIPQRARFISIVLLVVGGGMLLLLFRLLGVDAYLTDYVGAYQAESGKGPLLFGVYFIELAMFVYYVSKVKRHQREPLVVYVVYVLFALLIFRVGRRRIAIETGIGLLTLRHFCYKPVRWRTLVVLALLALPVLAVVGRARAFLNQGLQGMADYVRYEFSLSNIPEAITDTAVVPLSLEVTTQRIPASEPYRWGSTIRDGLLNLIPQVIYPNRPQTPSGWMAWTHNPRVAAMGGAYSFSLIAEGYMNWGYIGAFLFCLVEAIYIRALVEYRRSRPNSQGRILLYAVLATLSIGLIRTDLATLLKIGVTTIPAFFVSMWLGQTPPKAFQSTLRPFHRARVSADSVVRPESAQPVLRRPRSAYSQEPRV